MPKEVAEKARSILGGIPGHVVDRVNFLLNEEGLTEISLNPAYIEIKHEPITATPTTTPVPSLTPSPTPTPTQVQTPVTTVTETPTTPPVAIPLWIIPVVVVVAIAYALAR